MTTYEAMGDEKRFDDVLAHVDVALLAARMARPDGPADTIKSALREARDDLERMRADATRHPGTTPTRKDDAMRRRDLLRFGSLCTVTALVPLDALERWADTRRRQARVDGALLDSLDEAGSNLAKSLYTARPEELLGPARLHMNRLESLNGLSMATTERYRLDSMLSDAAALAGWLALDSDRKGEARAYFGLAADAARKAGNPTLHALAVASIGVSQAPSYGGEADGASAWHLRQASRQLPGEAPDYARAWVDAHLAKEEAAVGHAYAFHAALEQVDRALARGNAPEPIGSFWSDDAWFSYLTLPNWRDDFLGRGLAYLGQQDAGEVLDRLLADAVEPRTVARLHLSLAEWRLGRDEPDAAARATARALGATPAWDARAWALRRRLEPYRELDAVKELDEVMALRAA